MDNQPLASAYRIYSNALNDRRLQQLPPVEYQRQFYAALAGETNAWSPFLRVDNTRPPTPEWAVLRAAAFTRDNYTCQYCGQRGGRLECDHVIPVSRGGTHTLANLNTACFACNRAKRDKTLEEWQR